MTRVLKLCLASGTAAVLALAANNVSAGNLTIHTTTPTVKVPTPTSKVIVHTPQVTGGATAVGAGGAGQPGLQGYGVNWKKGDPGAQHMGYSVNWKSESSVTSKGGAQ